MVVVVHIEILRNYCLHDYSKHFTFLFLTFLALQMTLLNVFFIYIKILMLTFSFWMFRTTVIFLLVIPFSVGKLAIWFTHCDTHTHTHTTVLLLLWNMSGTTWVSRYQKGKTREVKTNLDLLEQEIVSGSGICWAICKSAPHPRQPRQHPTTQLFTGRMPFLLPNQQHQTENTWTVNILNILLLFVPMNNV